MKIYLAGERQVASNTVARDVESSGGQAPLWLKFTRRRLFSYYYHGMKHNQVSKDVEASHEVLKLDLFLDSGAFTAFTKNKEIDIDRYGSFLQATKPMWKATSSLDFIGRGDEAAKRSYNNFQHLIKQGHDVCPVFHVREPDSWLQRYIDEGWSYIFIGGMVPETTGWLQDRLDHLFDRLLCRRDGSPRVRTHGFGLTTQALMFRYPWFSVDSTSWLMTGIFGSCVFSTGQGKLRKVDFSHQSGSLRKVDGWHYWNLSPREKRVVDGWLSFFNITAEDCAKHYSYRDAVNAGTFQSLEEFGCEEFRRERQTLF